MKEELEELIEKVRELKLSSKEMMYLAYRILMMEYDTPRTQREVEKRSKALITIVDKILTTYYTPHSALNFIANLGERLLKRHPELRHQEESYEYIG
ncbi:MAG: hypothetical protein QXK24_00040 [Ignisphaera sp.]